ncbi:hypothetical protein HT031_005424 [Scenedesmus sp. PABB004]|nr:hypothetical protein HT031_005424 [Scenedesmus sp. PABB004]
MQLSAEPQALPAGFSPFAGGAHGLAFLPPTPPRPGHALPPPSPGPGALPWSQGRPGSASPADGGWPYGAAGGGGGGFGGLSRSGSAVFGASSPGPGGGSPGPLAPADLLLRGAGLDPHAQPWGGGGAGSGGLPRQLSSGALRRQDSWGDGGGGVSLAAMAAAGALPPPYGSSPLTRAATASAQQLAQQHAAAALARSLSVDADAAPPHGGAGVAPGGRRGWGGHDDAHGRLHHTAAGTGDVRRMLGACTFKPRLPGLTKLVSQLSRDGHWAKAMEVFESLDAVGVRPDTTITNAAISACDKGGQWEKALGVFGAMSGAGLGRDAITYSALISALSKGRQWGLAIDVFNHMVAEGVECDAVFIQMYREHTVFHILLEGMTPDPSPGGAGPGAGGSPSLLAGAFSAAALSALSIPEDAAPPGGGDTGGECRARPAAAAPAGPAPAPAEAPAGGGGPGGGPTAPGSPDGPPGGQPGPAARGDGGGLVHTLSGAWSKVVGANRAAAAAAAAPAAAAAAGPAGAGDGVSLPSTLLGSASSASSAGSAGSVGSPRGAGSAGSGEGRLAASDAVVLLPGSGAQPAGGGEPGGLAARSLSAQLSQVGLTPPGGAAPGGEPAPPTSAAAALVPAGASPSRSRPPACPLPAAQPSPARVGSLGRAGSLGAGSPGGGLLRLGRSGSLNSKKCSPNRVCCNALLAAYARAVPPRWKQALRLLQARALGTRCVMWTAGGELVPDIVSYNTVMKACGNAQQTSTAFELYSHMLARGVEPTVATYGTLITIASEAQDYSRVKEAWDWLQASGLPVHVTCANSYLTALIKEVRPARGTRACAAWARAAQQTRAAGAAASYDPARGAAPAVPPQDAWDAAVELFGQLKTNALGVRPNAVTFNILMSACLARDSPHMARCAARAAAPPRRSRTRRRRLPRRARARAPPPGVAMRRRAAGRAAAAPQVRGLFDELADSGLTPTLISYNTLLHALAMLGAVDDALRLLQHISSVRPSATSFNTVFATLANAAAAAGGELERQALCARALEAYRLMLAQPGLHPDTALFRSLVAAFAACGAARLVVELALTMGAQGHALDPATAAAALECVQREGAWGEAGALLRAAHAASAVVSPVLLQRLLLACAGEGAWRAAREVLQVACDRGQLDAVAELLQQHRAALAGGGAPAGPALCADVLDELTLLAFLQAQHASGGWAEGLALLRKLRDDRGPGWGAANGALLGALLDLLLVRGGAEGAPSAVALVDEAHAAGSMGHYLVHPSSLGGGGSGGSPCRGSPCGGSPGAAARRAPSPGAAGLAAGALSPEQALILQLEHAAITGSPPGGAPVLGGAGGGGRRRRGARGRGARPGGAGRGGAEAGGAAAPARAGSSPAGAGPAAAAGRADGPGGGVHGAVLAVLSGHLARMLGCGTAMDMLLPFSSAGRLALGLVCCGPLPALLPPEEQGGGVLLPTAALARSIAAALEVAHGG